MEGATQCRSVVRARCRSGLLVWITIGVQLVSGAAVGQLMDTRNLYSSPVARWEYGPHARSKSTPSRPLPASEPLDETRVAGRSAGPEDNHGLGALTDHKDNLADGKDHHQLPDLSLWGYPLQGTAPMEPKTSGPARAPGCTSQGVSTPNRDGVVKHCSKSKGPAYNHAAHIDKLSPDGDILSPLGEGYHSSVDFLETVFRKKGIAHGPLCTKVNLPAVFPANGNEASSIVTNATLVANGQMSHEGGTAHPGFQCFDLYTVVATRPCDTNQITCGPLLSSMACYPGAFGKLGKGKGKRGPCAVDMCEDLRMPNNWRENRLLCVKEIPGRRGLLSLVCKQKFETWAGQCSSLDELGNRIWD
ncbi:hypothetical protein CDD80_5782 [Ophiocordyceps camponoti-rufipedis]|uniref:Uncharacterized protein n=1 Tax=Ophiocordyceps camponoti-rufipedis TaxID=2004952 RepID=A0A2C5YTR1_9HYPO|nr:hypothetical protein CDD80_5782 [Ophiocordyceps camponoti-rufipedis]